MKEWSTCRRPLIVITFLTAIFLIALPLLAWAVNGNPAEEINLGPYALPLLLTVILGLIYNVVGAIPDRWKPLITIGVAVGLSMLVVAYKGEGWTFRLVVDYVLYGLMTGAAAIGLYESKRALFNPRA